MISNRNKLILASGRDIYISSILSLCGYLAKLNIEPNETEYFNPEYHTNIPFSNYYSKLETFWIFSFFFTLFIDLGFSEDSTYVVNTSSKNIPPSPIQLKNRCYILIIWMIWMIWKLDSGLLIFDLNTCYCIVLSCFFLLNWPTSNAIYVVKQKKAVWLVYIFPSNSQLNCVIYWMGHFFVWHAFPGFVILMHVTFI